MIARHRHTAPRPELGSSFEGAGQQKTRASIEERLERSAEGRLVLGADGEVGGFVGDRSGFDFGWVIEWTDEF